MFALKLNEEMQREEKLLQLLDFPKGAGSDVGAHWSRSLAPSGNDFPIAIKGRFFQKEPPSPISVGFCEGPWLTTGQGGGLVGRWSLKAEGQVSIESGHSLNIVNK